jgi:hypothetical protein
LPVKHSHDVSPLLPQSFTLSLHHFILFQNEATHSLTQLCNPFSFLFVACWSSL